MTEFDLQRYLEGEFGEVKSRLDDVIKTQGGHEARLQVVELTQKNIMRVAWAAVVGVFAALWDIVRNHYFGR